LVGVEFKGQFRPQVNPPHKEESIWFAGPYTTSQTPEVKFSGIWKYFSSSPCSSGAYTRTEERGFFNSGSYEFIGCAAKEMVPDNIEFVVFCSLLGGFHDVSEKSNLPCR
jgi:hypothetical protein